MLLLIFVLMLAGREAMYAIGSVVCRNVTVVLVWDQDVVMFFCLRGAMVVCLAAVAFPCFVIGLLVFPLCGGAPTFLCRPQRKVGKRKRLYTASS